MNPTGIKIPRSWLCYSVDLNRVYCETCWLFADRNNPKFNVNWINGLNDWQHLSQKIKVHEISIQHINAVKVRILWVKHQTIDKQLEEHISIEAKYWRDVLTRIIKIILFLTSGNTALRGNEGKSRNSREDEGNFLRAVRLVADFDPVLNKLLSDEETRVKYLSWKVQNEIIDLLATRMRNIICDEIRSSQCYTIIMDSTQDISKTDQVSFILRYAVVNYADCTFEIKESFLGFFTLNHHGAEDHVNLIKDVLNMFNLDLSKCRGQGYDGAAVMSGSHSGVQKRISDIIPSASYVHCNAHNLNLVLCDLAKSTPKVSQFFDTLQDVFLFYSKSAPRWASLALGDSVAKIVLKKVCTTRWEAKHKAVYALKTRFIDVLKSLSNLSLTSLKTDEKLKASSLKKKIESYEFVLLLTIWENILRSFNLVSKKLQSSNIHLHSACNYLKEATSSITNLRDKYEEFVNSSNILCNQWGIPIQSIVRRRIYSKRFFDDVDGDRRLDITSENFKVLVFLPIIDTAIVQLRERFNSLYEVTNRFDFLLPQNILMFCEKDIMKAAYDFQLFYKDDISTDIIRQILCLKSMFNDTLKTKCDIKDLLQCILDNDVASTYNDILSACIIFITLPVTVAAAERSFSKLKIIKNYLRNSISQDRLTNISILNIERNRTNEIDSWSKENSEQRLSLMYDGIPFNNLLAVDEIISIASINLMSPTTDNMVII
ncbi:zinc finger MYM-type protein 1-like [Rhopalosiphum padi]|uniref:zinc finger MYM-type protein 1-like n=1 Tax=Rhopalosiphum padi TaxID=40932 RepID=UPI00298E733A|nr:zinc finger MYM-type protein 1-like [Rhopalosiphum padi]